MEQLIVGTNREKLKSVGFRVIENVALVLAFFLLIPPIPSSPATELRFTPLGPLACGLFLASRYLALRRDAESWVWLFVQVIAFAAFAVVLFLRVVHG